MGIDDVLELVDLKSEQAPQSIDEVRERYNMRAEAEWNDLSRDTRAGVAFKLSEMWDHAIDSQDPPDAATCKRIRNHFRTYADDPD